MAMEGVSFVSSLLLMSSTRRPMKEAVVSESGDFKTQAGPQRRRTRKHHNGSQVGQLVVVQEELLERLELTQLVRQLGEHVPAEIDLVKVLQLGDLSRKPGQPVALQVQLLELVQVANLAGQLLDVVVLEVETLQALETAQTCTGDEA